MLRDIRERYTMRTSGHLKQYSGDGLVLVGMGVVGCGGCGGVEGVVES